MASVLGDVRWPWIPGIAGGVAAALFGYLLAWHGIARAGGGPTLNRRQRFAVVLVGFVGFTARGGSPVVREAYEFVYSDILVSCLVRSNREGPVTGTIRA